MNTFRIAIFALAISFFSRAQNDSIPQNRLQEVVVSSTRIELPWSQHMRSMEIISSETIRKSGVQTVVDLLQRYAGIDIRRRGLMGMQADLYIRGGSFDQTLLLIDGIKLDDAQTGHHTLNFLPPPEVIERIEIVKGPAARIFGQNAFTGAVNIVTKKDFQKHLKTAVSTGSYNQWNTGITLANSGQSGGVLAHHSYNTSDGYRHNTDFDNHNYFLKSQWKTGNIPVDFMASFSERKFGANGFYASRVAVDQYEETQASLIGFSSRMQKDNWIVKPRLFWRRGQDTYVYIRNRPEAYRNLHITHKLGAGLDASYASQWGITGMGLEVSRISIASNNLGDRSRWMTTLFWEHRFSWWKNRLTVTPGVALNYYTDFKFHAFPGMDIGWRINPQWQLYGNMGYTYRIPTYTDLFYSDPTTLGNADLLPESALAQEVGIRFTGNKITFSTAFFNRDAEDLIDYAKDVEEALWEANNIRSLNTKGVEVQSKYGFKIGSKTQEIVFGYTYLRDDLDTVRFQYSRYSINSLKHHFTFNYQGQISSKGSFYTSYRYAQRTPDSPYRLLDVGLQWNFGKLQATLDFNNVFNETYSETNGVPMPEGNGRIGVQYTF